MSITNGIFTTYGFALKSCGPIAIWTWPLVAAGQILVAIIFAELAGRIPVTGYSYQWVSRLVGPMLGWLCGWVGICTLTLGNVPTNLAIAPIIARVINVDPKTSAIVIALAVLSAQALINLRGVKLTSLINNAAVYTEITGMIGISIMVAVAAFFLKSTPLVHPHLLNSFAPGIGSWSFGALVLGSMMACWTFVGFEFAADLSEETVGATKIIPRSIISSSVSGALIGMVFLVVITLAIPDLKAITNSENPLPDILKAALGQNLSILFLCVVIISMFANGVIWVTGASRLIYSMARDGVFIFPNFFKRVSKNRIPGGAVALVFIANVLATVFAGSITDLLAVTAILPVVIYLTTIGAYAFRTKGLSQVDTFHLGKWSAPLTFIALIWLIAELGIVTIPKEFHGGAKLSLMLILAGVIVYFLVVRKGITQGEAGIQEKYV